MKKIYPLILIGFVLFIFLFYWFQIRPANIRSSCQQEVKAKAAKPEYKDDISATLVNNWFRICLVSHGLKAEDLVSE